MKDEGLRAPLLYFTPTLPLILVTQLHNSYVVTGHPQPASLESPLVKVEVECQTQIQMQAAFIYLTANITRKELMCCTVTGLARDSSVVQRHAEVGLIFPTLYHFQITPLPSNQISKQASFILCLYNFNLVWHFKKVQSVSGVSGYSSAASGMVFYA